MNPTRQVGQYNDDDFDNRGYQLAEPLDCFRYEAAFGERALPYNSLQKSLPGLPWSHDSPSTQRWTPTILAQRRPPEAAQPNPGKPGNDQPRLAYPNIDPHS